MQYRNHTTDRKTKNLIVLPWTAHALYAPCIEIAASNRLLVHSDSVSRLLQVVFFPSLVSVDRIGRFLQFIIVFMNAFFVCSISWGLKCLFSCALINIESMFYCSFSFGFYLVVIAGNAGSRTSNNNHTKHPNFRNHLKTVCMCARAHVSSPALHLHVKQKKLPLFASDCCCRHHLRCYSVYNLFTRWLFSSLRFIRWCFE